MQHTSRAAGMTAIRAMQSFLPAALLSFPFENWVIRNARWSRFIRYALGSEGNFVRFRDFESASSWF